MKLDPFQTAGGTQKWEVASLNEQQATLLITYLRNTGPVRELKLKLVQDFYAMRQMLMGQKPSLALYRGRDRSPGTADHQSKGEGTRGESRRNYPEDDDVDTSAADDDKILFRTVASSLDMTEKALRQLLILKGGIYAEETTRWSNKRQEKVNIT